jgi:hypothetical protein
MPAIWAEAATLSYRYYDPYPDIHAYFLAVQILPFVHVSITAVFDNE